jgi:hypothetical protein
MSWCENNGIDYIFGLSGTKPLARKVDEVADDMVGKFCEPTRSSRNVVARLPLSFAIVVSTSAPSA